tara:strand:+ start:6304 stop:9084 length:2781 start_codon:yes stop_codon:yes gene_type:complete
MSLRYGFQRLVLLGSAGYQRAELPLDDSVSLIAPNNTGKTALINALQYLLIIDKRRMDFGAHSTDKSRRFYFPNNSAFILLEVMLPETGSLVLGCVGKGVSHDYEYFAYKGALNIDDFRLPNGAIVAQPQLRSHLAELGKSVFSYSSTEFVDLLYGGKRKRTSQDADFTVFQLEYASDAPAFQRVLTRTLKLDKLRSSDVKEHLLQIFRRDLPDASIDFKQEWDKAFADVNADREQYQAALAQKQHVDELEKLREERLILRGKLIVTRPLISQGLEQWQEYYTQTLAGHEQEKTELETENTRLLERDRELTLNQSSLRGEVQHFQGQAKQQGALEQKFALVSQRDQLESSLTESKTTLEQQIALVNRASSREPGAITRDIKRNKDELEQNKRELATLADNLWRRLSEQLDSAEIEQLNRLFNQDVMTLPTGEFALSKTAVLDFLNQSEKHKILLPGLTISVATLSAQYQQRTEAEIGLRIEELRQEFADLVKQLEAASALDAARAHKNELEQEVRHIERDLESFDLLTELKQGETDRSESLKIAEKSLDEIGEKLDRSTEYAQGLRQRQAEVERKIKDLTHQDAEIGRKRDHRGDEADQFGYLDALAHHPWLGEPELPLIDLLLRLTQYQKDCARLLELDRQLTLGLSELHANGLTKYQYSGDDEGELTRIIDFCQQLTREEEALEKKARSAVVTVTASLRELRDGLRAFKNRMREFNRLVSHRQLSDLKVFKIEPEDETVLVEAMTLLISTAEQVESGDSFELFDQGSVLDDDALDRAKQTLIDEGNARQGLRVSDLFRLSFVVGKIDGESESFDDLDSAASNGTVLMAKLVTGLAMLHLMQDKRRNVQAVCYLDEALALDARNQKSLIDTAADFGFALIFASPAPLATARYCVPIQHREGKNYISQRSWQIFEPLSDPEVMSAQ